MFEKIKFVFWIIINIAVFVIGVFRAIGRFNAGDILGGTLYVGALIGFVILCIVITVREVIPQTFPKKEEV